MTERDKPRKGKLVDFSCTVCGKVFQDYPRKRSPRLFCSKACRGKSLQRRVERKCVECGSIFSITEGRLARGDGAYCGLSCAAAHRFREYWTGRKQTEDHVMARSGPNASRWNGGQSHGYRMVGRGDNEGRAIAEHRLVAETALGRPLKKGEVVHHVNGVKTDNRNKNLIICSRSYHAWLHRRMSFAFQRMTFDPPPVEAAI